MDAIISKLISESPVLAALVILVYLHQKGTERITKDFTETIKDRDTIFLDMIQKITDKLEAMDLRHTAHAEETSKSIDAMFRHVSKKIPRKNKQSTSR